MINGLKSAQALLPQSTPSSPNTSGAERGSPDQVVLSSAARNGTRSAEGMSAAWDDNAMKSPGMRQVLYNDARDFTKANPNNPTFVKNGHVYFVHGDEGAVSIFEGRQHHDDDVTQHEGHALPPGSHTMDAAQAWTIWADGSVEDLMMHKTDQGVDGAGRPIAMPDHPAIQFTTHRDRTPASFQSEFVADPGV